MHLPSVMAPPLSPMDTALHNFAPTTPAYTIGSHRNMPGRIQASAGTTELHKSNRGVSYCMLSAADALSRGINDIPAQQLDHLFSQPQEAANLRDA